MKFLIKPTAGMAVLLAITLLEGGTETPAREVTGGNALTDREVAPWITKRVQEWQITAAERPFDRIGWAKDIRDAERLAKEHGRPVFLFTYDGQMAIGRC